MKTIDITTTQNVGLEYRLAGLWERCFAWFLDVLIIAIGQGILRGIIGFVVPSELFLNYFITIPIIFFYTPMMEIATNGQTIGKMALNIRVVKVSGTNPEVSDFLMRWSFRIFDIYLSLGTIAAILIGSTAKAQRMGDTLANTVVIKETKQYMLSLREILNIQTQDNYEITYPQVTKFNERDMLTIKNALDRHHRHPNKAHREAVIKVADMARQQLEVREMPKSKAKFLRTLLRDYIVLTR